MLIMFVQQFHLCQTFCSVSVSQVECVCVSASREGLRSAWLSARVKTRVCWPDPVSRQLDLGRYTSDKQTKKQVCVVLNYKKRFHNSSPSSAILSRSTKVTDQWVVKFVLFGSLLTPCDWISKEESQVLTSWRLNGFVSILDLDPKRDPFDLP